MRFKRSQELRGLLTREPGTEGMSNLNAAILQTSLPRKGSESKSGGNEATALHDIRGKFAKNRSYRLS